MWASNFTRVISEHDLASTEVPKNLSSFNLEVVHIYRVDVCIRPRDFILQHTQLLIQLLLMNEG